MLVTIGDLVEDVVVVMDQPLALGTDTASRIHHRPGGSAANTARAARRCGIAARFVGAVGDDPTGDRLLDRLRADGVDVRVARRAGRTGTVVVLVHPDGERTMLTDRGTAAELDVLPAEALADADWLHLPAYGLAHPAMAAVLRAAAAAAHAADPAVPVSVDASSTRLAEALGGPSALRAAIAALGPQVVHANADEARLLGLLTDPLPGVLVAVTRGADGVDLVGGAGSAWFPAGVRHVPHGVVPGHDAAVRDTTGAGDSWCAGFVGALAAGADPVAACAAGHTCALVWLHGHGENGQP